jgi:hypothetical protein
VTGSPTTPSRTPSPSPHASVGSGTATVWISSDGRVVASAT